MPDLKLRLTLSKTFDLVASDDLLVALNEKLLDNGVDAGVTATKDDIESAIRDLWEEDPTGLLEVEATDLSVETISGSFETIYEPE